MIISHQLVEEESFIRLEADLAFSPQSTLDLFQSGLLACRNTGKMRLLVSVPRLEPLSLLSKVMAGIEMADLYERQLGDATKHIRVAILASPQVVVERKLIEEEFMSRGLPLRAFTQERLALEWLLSEG